MVTIRPARAADLAAITPIYAHYVLTGLASFETTAPGEAEMRQRWDNLVTRGYPYIVAEEDGRILGYAYAGPYRTRPAYRFTVENSVYIDTGDVGKGVGRSLLAELIVLCEARGFRQMIAIIADQDNNAASIGLHTALGFEHAGVLRSVGFKSDNWVDTAVMQRALGSGDATLPGEKRAD